MTLTDYIRKEKKKEEDKPAVKIARMHQYEDLKITLKKKKQRLITEAGLWPNQ